MLTSFTSLMTSAGIAWSAGPPDPSDAFHDTLMERFGQGALRDRDA